MNPTNRVITLPAPVTYTIPPVGGKTFPLQTRTQLGVRWIDDGSEVRAKIDNIPIPLVLWKGDDYTNIGEWKEADAQAQFKALLATNPTAVLQGLFKTL